MMYNDILYTSVDLPPAFDDGHQVYVELTPRQRWLAQITKAILARKDWDLLRSEAMDVHGCPWYLNSKPETATCSGDQEHRKSPVEISRRESWAPPPNARHFGMGQVLTRWHTMNHESCHDLLEDAEIIQQSDTKCRIGTQPYPTISNYIQLYLTTLDSLDRFTRWMEMAGLRRI